VNDKKKISSKKGDFQLCGEAFVGKKLIKKRGKRRGKSIDCLEAKRGGSAYQEKKTKKNLKNPKTEDSKGTIQEGGLSGGEGFPWRTEEISFRKKGSEWAQEGQRPRKAAGVPPGRRDHE